MREFCDCLWLLVSQTRTSYWNKKPTTNTRKSGTNTASNPFSDLLKTIHMFQETWHPLDIFPREVSSIISKKVCPNWTWHTDIPKLNLLDISNLNSCARWCQTRPCNLFSEFTNGLAIYRLCVDKGASNREGIWGNDTTIKCKPLWMMNRNLWFTETLSAKHELRQTRKRKSARTKSSNRLAFPLCRRLAFWLALALTLGFRWLALSFTCASLRELAKIAKWLHYFLVHWTVKWLARSCKSCSNGPQGTGRLI